LVHRCTSPMNKTMHPYRESYVGQGPVKVGPGPGRGLAATLGPWLWSLCHDIVSSQGQSELATATGLFF